MVVVERDRLADHGSPDVLPGEHLGGGGTRLAQDPEEEMLGAHALMAEPVGLLPGVLEHPLRFRRQRHPDGGGDAVPEQRPATDLGANSIDREPQPRREGGRQLAEQAEQEVFGLDRVASELGGLVPGEVDGALGALRVPLEHCW